MKLVITTLALSLGLAGSHVVRADAPAPSHVANAMEAHKAGNFTLALSELQLAYAEDPRPELLFALGQVHVKLGRCGDAIGYYEQYLATTPSAQSSSATREAIATCKAQIASQPPAPTPPVASAPATVSSGERGPWYTDKLGDGLVLGGVAAAAIGLLLYAGARGDLDDAERAPDLARYQTLVDSAHEKRTWSVVLGGGGVILIGAGVAHYVLRGRPTETRGVGVVPTARGGFVTWTGRF